MPPRDIAPGDAQVAWRQGRTAYYVPALFHTAPTHGKVVPLTIRDVVKCKSTLEIYGVQGVEQHHQGYVMVHNYPVRTVKIRGRVLSYKSMTFGNKDRGQTRFYLVYIDDYSGGRSSVCAKIPWASAAFPAAAMANDVLVEVTGTVVFSPNFAKQVHASSARIVGTARDFDTELEWWSAVLQIRQFLAVPWKKQPCGSGRERAPAAAGESGESDVEVVSESDVREVFEPRFSRRDAERRRQKSELVLFADEPVPSQFQSASDSVVVVDSDDDFYDAEMDIQDSRKNSQNGGLAGIFGDEDHGSLSNSDLMEFGHFDSTPLGSFRSQTVLESVSGDSESISR